MDERVTYVGHATVLLEVGGARMLTDPILRGRVAHLRRHGGAVDHGSLGELDAVLVSHAHLDHLHAGSLKPLARADAQPVLIVPPGARRHVAKLGFADVRNHLTSEKLQARMGTDLFAWHGYTELLLPDPDQPGERRWFKVSSAFNIELCERFGVRVLEFDGTADALMHPYDVAGNRHMEYVRQRGSCDDLPLDEIVATFTDVYGDRFGTTPGDGVDPAFA